MQAIPNKAMLITYPDSMGGNLKALYAALSRHLRGAFGSLHILPFFPSSGDRGFSPTTYDRVDPAFGDWPDIRALADQYAIMCDMMVNHISRQSVEFADYFRHGDASPYAGMFFDYDAFWGGEPPAEEYAALYKRSDKPLYAEVTLPDGAKKRLWCSFSQQQIDLDTDAPVTRQYIMENLKRLGDRGISIVRLDAYGYITKIRGTHCFFEEPKIWELIAGLDALLSARGMTLLPEVHDRYETALKIAEHGYHTYDFVLPMLMLHTLTSRSGGAMKRWFQIAPRKQFTVLDTHDGVGVYDADGIVPQAEAEAVIRRIEPNLSYRYKPMDESKKKYKKAYQLYGTFYSMLGGDDRAYRLARALQLFAPGIPQVYYVGLLAGENALDFPPEDHRFINRKNYTEEELAAAFARPLVRDIVALLRFRSSHPAFGGTLTLGDTDDARLSLVWANGGGEARMEADLRDYTFSITAKGPGGTRLVMAQ